MANQKKGERYTFYKIYMGYFIFAHSLAHRPSLNHHNVMSYLCMLILFCTSIPFFLIPTLWN